MCYSIQVRNLSDKELISSLEKTVKLERKFQVTVLCYLAEVEKRKLFAILGYSSMFKYVTQSLSYSEASALKRIQVSRAAMRYPQIFDLIEQGKASLTALMKICPHLRDHNFFSLLKAIENKSVKQVEQWLAGKFPKPEPSDTIKPLSEDRV